MGSCCKPRCLSAGVRVWPLRSGSAAQPPTSLNQGHQPSPRSTQPLVLFNAWAPGPPLPCEKEVNRPVYRLCSRRFFWGQCGVSNLTQQHPATLPLRNYGFPIPRDPSEAVSHRCPASHHWCVMQLANRSTPSALCSDSSQCGCESLQVISTFSLVDPSPPPNPPLLAFSISVNDNSISSCCSGKKSWSHSWQLSFCQFTYDSSGSHAGSISKYVPNLTTNFTLVEATSLSPLY